MNYIKSFIFNSQKKASLLQEVSRDIKYFISNSMYKCAASLNDWEKKQYYTFASAVDALNEFNLGKREHLKKYFNHVIKTYPEFVVKSMKDPKSALHLEKLDPYNPSEYVKSLHNSLALQKGGVNFNYGNDDILNSYNNIVDRREASLYLGRRTGAFHITSKTESKGDSDVSNSDNDVYYDRVNSFNPNKTDDRHAIKKMLSSPYAIDSRVKDNPREVRRYERTSPLDGRDYNNPSSNHFVPHGKLVSVPKFLDMSHIENLLSSYNNRGRLLR